MARSIFILKDGSSTVPTLIFLFARVGGRRLLYSTQEKILPSLWDNTIHRANVRKLRGRDLTNAQFINENLSKYERAFREVADHLKFNYERETVDAFRNGLDQRLGKEKKNTFDYQNIGKTFNDFVEYQIKTANVKEGTKKVYNDLLTHLEGYTKGRKLEFQEIDMRFYAGFTHYLTCQFKRTLKDKEGKLYEVGLSANTIAKYVRTLKALLSSSFDKGLHTQLDFKKRSFKAITEDTVKVYLTEQELSKLIKLDNLSETHERVRDMFIVACRTALRYSDIENLKPENFINNNTLIKSYNTKTGAEVVIPVHPDVRYIWEKYNHKLPKIEVNQVFNRYLKDIGRNAKINTPVPIQYTVGGKLERRTVAKYELITTHTGRRTFATLTYLAGVPTIASMKITGHKTESAYMKYIRISAEESATELLKHKFFSSLKAVK